MSMRSGQVLSKWGHDTPYHPTGTTRTVASYDCLLGTVAYEGGRGGVRWHAEDSTQTVVGGHARGLKNTTGHGPGPQPFHRRRSSKTLTWAQWCKRSWRHGGGQWPCKRGRSSGWPRDGQPADEVVASGGAPVAACATAAGCPLCPQASAWAGTEPQTDVLIGIETASWLTRKHHSPIAEYDGTSETAAFGRNAD